MSDVRQTNPTVRRRSLEIDFWYLDLKVCDRCRATDSSLRSAVRSVKGILKATGIDVKVRHIHVKTEPQARRLGFEVSPTLRLNGRDIQMHWKESPCESCGSLCGADGTVACREWFYDGKWHPRPTEVMIIDAILREVYSGYTLPRPVQPPQVAGSKNLEKFFRGKNGQGSKVCC